MNASDWLSVLPPLLLVAGGLAAVALDLRRGKAQGERSLPELASYLALAGALGVVVLRLAKGGAPALVGFDGTVVLDDFALFLSLAIVVAAGFMSLLTGDHVRGRGIPEGEFYALVLMGTAGMLLLVQAAELITFFVALEILSLCVYVLSGIFRRDPRSNEAAVKYFVTGAFATGFLLYGAALLYGATGTLELARMGPALAQAEGSSLPTLGLVLLSIGLAFKVGAVPFHMWVADVYEGAPTSVTAFMSVAVKAAGFGGFLRVLFATMGGVKGELVGELLAALALATMIVGNLLAMRQQSVKRMLAYSSVAHTGYVLVGLVAAWDARGAARPDLLASPAVFYLFVYTFMTLGAFAFLILIRRNGRDAEDLEDYAGLAQRRPWSALAMTLFMVSLSGIPPTAGFFGKFVLFGAAIETGRYLLVVVGVLTSALSVYYYLLVVVYMYMHPEPAPPAEEKPAPNVGIVVAITAAFTAILGVLPSAFLEYARRSIDALR